ncbi:hypothetical protein HK101_008960, partial [Irineochytrium annulatum]
RLAITDLRAYQDLIHPLDTDDDPTTTSFHLDTTLRSRVKRFMDANAILKHPNVTVMEWTCMQNPRGKWQPTRPPCPGQKFPSLGVARWFTSSVQAVAERKGRDGLVNTPEHLNNALLYHEAGYRFVSPAFEGYVLALVGALGKDLKDHGIAAVAWALRNGHVVDEGGRVEVWRPQEMLLPLSEGMSAYFSGQEYKALVEEFKLHFGKRKMKIRWDEAVEIWQYSVKWLKESGWKG